MFQPFVKPQKNDAIDAEAICVAAVRPSMRFVPVKSEKTQGRASDDGSGGISLPRAARTSERKRPRISLAQQS